MKYPTFESGQYYHVYNRGNNRENLFKEEENYHYFLRLLEKHLIHVVDMYSFCLLPNHFHFVLRIKEEQFLPSKFRSGKSKLHQPFSNLFNAYSKAFNKKYIRTGSLFKEHLKRIKIEDERYLKNLILYVNTNSNHHNIADYERYKKTWLPNGSEIFELFGGKENFKYSHRLKKINIELIKNLIFED
jgi:REP element-mobilizing transposase RayT